MNYTVRVMLPLIGVKAHRGSRKFHVFWCWTVAGYASSQLHILASLLMVRCF